MSTRTTVGAVSIRSSLLCWERRIEILTNSLTIFEEPLRASLCTLDSSLLDDFDLDLAEVDFEAGVDLEADADFDVDEEDFEVRVVLGSDMAGVVVVLNGWRGVFVVC